MNIGTIYMQPDIDMTWRTNQVSVMIHGPVVCARDVV